MAGCALAAAMFAPEPETTIRAVSGPSLVVGESWNARWWPWNVPQPTIWPTSLIPFAA